MAAKEKTPSVTLSLGGHDVVVSHPDKVYFPQAGITKLELVQYYLDVADAVLRGVRARPMVLRRFVHGIDGEPFFQKRAPAKLPPYLRTAQFRYASGGVADEIVVDDVAGLAWVVNLGCVEMHAHPLRADDLEHPDELRVDLDPVPGVSFRQVQDVARVVHEVLDDFGLTGWPKTSGSRGVHVWVRIQRLWGFDQVRRAGLALAREVERRAPSIATSKWAKEERHGVLVDYNQNAKDRTTASAYSVRPVPDARVSMPLTWADLDACNPADFTLRTVPALVQKNGDAHLHIDDETFSIERLLALADELDPKYKPRGKKERLPLITIAQAKQKADALAGLERWKVRHPEVFALLAHEDVLVDANRGRFSAWYRVRINLKSVPVELRPPQETPDPDYDPSDDWARVKESPRAKG